MKAYWSLSPQCRKIVNHCKRAGHITARSALLDYGIMSLSRRMCDLKGAGYKVRSETTTHPATGQKYARYFVSVRDV